MPRPRPRPAGAGEYQQRKGKMWHRTAAHVVLEDSCCHCCCSSSAYYLLIKPSPPATTSSVLALFLTPNYPLISLSPRFLFIPPPCPAILICLISFHRAAPAVDAPSPALVARRDRVPYDFVVSWGVFFFLSWTAYRIFQRCCHLSRTSLVEETTLLLSPFFRNNGINK